MISDPNSAKLFSKSSLIPERRWLRLEHINSFWEYCEKRSDIDVQKIGESEEGRPIRLIKWGKGSTKVLAWTQMHGNEPTASLAIADLLEYLDLDQHPNLFQKLELQIILMLNPDGAARFSRRNAWGIDLNRDARTQSSKEMQVFYQHLNNQKIDWAFNLHDQRNIFAAGAGSKTATLSFLAPSADISRALSPVRKQSMQLIAGIHAEIQGILPSHFGRYTDEFYPRAIGDNLMQAGIPTVLFEAGHYPADVYRQKARELNFKGLVAAFDLIASGNWSKHSVEDYLSIPENGNHLRDFLFRGIEYDGRQFDIALMRQERPDFKTGELNPCYIVDDIGDLSHLTGIEEIESGKLSGREHLKFEGLANFSVQADLNYHFKDGILQKH